MLARNPNGHYSPLQSSVINDFYEGVKILLRLKDQENNYVINVNELSLLNGETAHHKAVRIRCNKNILVAILSRPDCQINDK